MSKSPLIYTLRIIISDFLNWLDLLLDVNAFSIIKPFMYCKSLVSFYEAYEKSDLAFNCPQVIRKVWSNGLLARALQLIPGKLAFEWLFVAKLDELKLSILKKRKSKGLLPKTYTYDQFFALTVEASDLDYDWMWSCVYFGKLLFCPYV